MANKKISDSAICLVTNRSAGRVGYNIPQLGVKRRFAPGETQKVTYGELVKLTYEPGGSELLGNFLQITQEETLNNLNVHVQPEYFMNDQQIKDLILNGSYDAFLDCLDYAPVGVIDLLKQYCISLPLSDYKKREAMKEKLNFDVDKALAMKKAEEEEAKNPGGFVADEAEKAKETAATPARSTGRRTTVSYKEPAAAK